MKDRIFILATKRSRKCADTVYCIAIFKLGSGSAEFIMGETDNDRSYKTGDETDYVCSAYYTTDLDTAVNWLKKQE
jgi:hypothetical protein